MRSSMLKKTIVIISVLTLIGCSTGYPRKSINKVIDYKTGEDTFVVIVVKEKMDQEQAMKEAKQRAAAITYKNGYKYFKIINKEESQVMIGKDGWPSSYDFPQNLYQEEIVDKGYNRDRFIEGSKEDYNLYPAIKFEIKSLRKAEKGSFYACDIIKCK